MSCYFLIGLRGNVILRKANSEIGFRPNFHLGLQQAGRTQPQGSAAALRRIPTLQVLQSIIKGTRTHY